MVGVYLGFFTNLFLVYSNSWSNGSCYWCSPHFHCLWNVSVGTTICSNGEQKHRPPCFPWRSFIVMKWALLCSKLEPKHVLIGCLPLQGRCSCVPLPNHLSGHVVSVHLLKESLHMRQEHASHKTCSLVTWPVFHLSVSWIFPRVLSVVQEWIGFLVYHMLKQSFQEGL